MNIRRNIINEEEQPTKKCRIAPNLQIRRYSSEDSCADSRNINQDILKVALQLIESSEESDSDSEIITALLQSKKIRESAKMLTNKRNCHKKKKCLDSNTAPLYTEPEFRHHFRISKTLFDNLLDNFSKSKVYTSLRVDKRLSANLHFSVFLWFAGHEACSFRYISERFNLSLGAVYNVIHRVAIYISSLAAKFIKWPNEKQKLASSIHFKSKCGFSKAIGCIGRTNLVIDAPPIDKVSYVDADGNTSICFQAVCNENNKFINIYLGHPGSVTDSWIFENSPLFDKLPKICGDYYILGDAAYSASKYVITPYTDYDNLTCLQKSFNTKLSLAKEAIEHTFRTLIVRFRQLNYCKLRDRETLCHLIRACCVLHNLSDETDFDFKSGILSDCYVPSCEATGGGDFRDAILQEMSKKKP